MFQCTVALIRALGRLDGPEQYTILVQSAAMAERLKGYCGPNQRTVVHEHLGERTDDDDPTGAKGVLGAVKRPFRPLVRRLRQKLSASRWPEIPLSDGFIEGLGCDVVHFPSVPFMLCNLPSVYNPHDLQHLLYPQNFTQYDLVEREVLMPAGCRFAHTVVVGTQWVKDDVIRRYQVDPEKVQIIPWASPTEFFSQVEDGRLAAVAHKYQIEAPFALYPATTFPYKNHLRLLEALAHLRDSRGLVVPLICTGGIIDWFWPKIDARIRELNLSSQVKFLGFVPDDELRALYRLSRFLVMPTLYEADSNPIHEAWFEGVPVASSNVTALPDQVQDAGLLFDPKDAASIAGAMARLATDESLRTTLRQRGHRRVGDFSWERTAKAFRAVYRRAGDFALTEEDRDLLQWDWLREPRRTKDSPYATYVDR